MHCTTLFFGILCIAFCEEQHLLQLILHPNQKIQEYFLSWRKQIQSPWQQHQSQTKIKIIHRFTNLGGTIYRTMDKIFGIYDRGIIAQLVLISKIRFLEPLKTIPKISALGSAPSIDNVRILVTCETQTSRIKQIKFIILPHFLLTVFL